MEVFMYRRVFCVSVFLAVLTASFIHGQTPQAAELLRRLDDNEIYTTIIYDGEMIIEYQNRRYTKVMKVWARENSDSFIEFTNPEDRGTKYLKRGGRLYVYSPDTEEVMLISGHMLKESMMGSDFSYEDTLENEKLSNRYNPVLAGTEIKNNRECWVLDLTAKRKTETYPKQKLWIDKETGDCLAYEVFALSGTKLKEYNLNRIETIGAHRLPVEMEIRDLLRRGSKTTLVMRNIILDQPIPNSVFSTRNLER
jgi:outer membrane lipoprotein-sorting protein